MINFYKRHVLAIPILLLIFAVLSFATGPTVWSAAVVVVALVWVVASVYRWQIT